MGGRNKEKAHLQESWHEIKKANNHTLFELWNMRCAVTLAPYLSLSHSPPEKNVSKLTLFNDGALVVPLFPSSADGLCLAWVLCPSDSVTGKMAGGAREVPTATVFKEPSLHW